MKIAHRLRDFLTLGDETESFVQGGVAWLDR
jgi:hypothetical protein